MKKYLLLFIFIILAGICGAILGRMFEGVPLTKAFFSALELMVFIFYLPIALLIYGLISVALYALFQVHIKKEIVRNFFYYILILTPTIIMFLFFSLVQVAF